MPYIDVTVDVDPDEFDDDELIEVLESRGYTLARQCGENSYDLEKSEIQSLITIVDGLESGIADWEMRRIRDKLFDMLVRT